MRTLYFVETTDLGTRHTALAARSLGYEPVYLCDPNAYAGDVRAQLLEQRVRLVDTTSVDEVVAAIERDASPGEVVVTSFADARLEVACLAAQRLGVPGLDRAVITLKSKVRVAELVPEHGPESLAIDLSAPAMLGLDDLLARHRRLVVKPSHGAGGLGVSFVDGPGASRDLRSRLEALALPSRVCRDGFLAQAYVAGELVSLEGYVEQGGLHVLGYTDRTKIGLTECGSRHPVDGRVPRDAARAIERAIADLVERSGLERGYLHAEFILGGDGPRLIDANVGRLGGGPVGELLAWSHRAPPEDVYRHAIEVGVLGRASASPYLSPELRRSSAAVLYGLERGGRLLGLDVPLVDGVRHTAVLGSGDRVPAMGTDDWAWIGVLTGVEQAIGAALAGLRIHTTVGVEAPCW
jgi:predicted ATP-grasp superfamily ATP-dependent carboligase